MRAKIRSLGWGTYSCQDCSEVRFVGRKRRAEISDLPWHHCRQAISNFSHVLERLNLSLIYIDYKFAANSHVQEIFHDREENEMFHI